MYKKIISFFAGMMVTSSFAAEVTTPPLSNQHLSLLQLPGFFRFSFDNIKMPYRTQSMGLLGVNYFADLTSSGIYGGLGGYGAITGTQGGLFTLGAAAGWRYALTSHLSSDVGLFVGGGGGKSSYVGGGLMLRPHAGIQYSWQWLRLGAYYSYVDFPSGKIRSAQFGLDLDLPTDFYYLSPNDNHINRQWFNIDDIRLPLGRYLGFQRNDFAILLQAYKQNGGTKNTDGEVQDGTIKLVGAELDHYFTEKSFWWLKTSGAFSGIPNGYMDVIGGLGYRLALGRTRFTLVPKFGVGAGGGGAVDTGGGLLLNPLIGIEWPLTSAFSARLSSGYLWSAHGTFKAVPITAELLYHLDLATAETKKTKNTADYYDIQGWRVQLLNQTYLHPKRSAYRTTSRINLIAVQLDQLFTPTFFLSYQAAAAYNGFHAGGYATGMLGPGIQSRKFYEDKVQFFAECLIGAGGGGGLALSGGSVIEPVLGLRYAFTPIMGLQASMSKIKAFHDKLNAPIVNIGLTVRFDTLKEDY